jgi:curved DNA-binding protein CbpA
LGVAAGDPENEKAAVEASGRPREIVRQAATFFIEQILLSPNADCYRVLGVSSTATSSELRRNMALLMRWLHPDAARQGEQAIFAARIANAWNNLKTPDRRTAYDAERQSARSPQRRGESSLGGGSRARSSYRLSGTGGLPRMLAFLLGKSRR